MSRTVSTAVIDLKLDLENFRTIKQKTEIAAINAMISISPGKFWGLMQSLIDDGYLPTENIIVIKTNDRTPSLIVKEGNRRVAALKIMLGHISMKPFELPSDLIEQINGLTPEWKSANEKIPCSIYSLKDQETVDRIVALTHAKGDKASRDNWTAVARARHNRDALGITEPGLDLLEKFLAKSSRPNGAQKERWTGDYNLTVLNEALGKSAKAFGFSSASELAKSYPKIKDRDSLEEMIMDIGLEILTFPKMRNTDILEKYGLPPTPTENQTKTPKSSSKSTTESNGSEINKAQGNLTTQSTATPTQQRKLAAVATTDPRSIKRILQKFSPKGKNREKVAYLRDEAKKLDIKKNPIAFCFLLRSMFEISAKAYCKDHSISYTKAGGMEKSLKDALREVTKHLTQNGADKAKAKSLHGAMAILATSDSLLSVDSMNALVHNPSFLIGPESIASLFGNIFPLLEEMNS